MREKIIYLYQGFLFIIFSFIFIPLGLMLKLFSLFKKEKDKNSYWIKYNS